MKALKYRSELNHVKNLGQELAVAHSKGENFYHSTDSCSDSTMSTSCRHDYRENLVFRNKNSNVDTAGQNFKSGLPRQNLGQLLSKLSGLLIN